MPSDLLMSRYNHDLDISSGTSVVVQEDNPQVVAQRVKIALLIRKGEFFLNTNYGVPYLTDFLIYRNNKIYIDSYMKAYINDVEDVNAVTDYYSEIEHDTRHLKITVDMNTRIGGVGFKDAIAVL